MTLPVSGSISVNDVNVELRITPTNNTTLNDTAVRTLFQKPTPASTISLSDGRGKSHITPSIQYLVVGGGGGGAQGGQWYTAAVTDPYGFTSYSTVISIWNSGGGGGGGGVVAGSLSVSLGQQFNVTAVGAGGGGGSPFGAIIGSGGNSVFNGITAFGGGRANQLETSYDYPGTANGGCGGGGSPDPFGALGGIAYGGGVGGTGSQGGAGGNSPYNSFAGAGGGGYSSGGAACNVSGNNGGNGGSGYLWTPTGEYFGCGGGGGGWLAAAGLGGNGVGGNGAPGNGGDIHGRAAPIANRGSGGGGGSVWYATKNGVYGLGYGGAGSAGIVAVAYPTDFIMPSEYPGASYSESNGYRVFKWTTGGGYIKF
jgi:hypothetical protein